MPEREPDETPAPDDPTARADDLDKTPRASGDALPAVAAAGARFQAGDLLANRYRIVALLGKGGMGEVYRADDLKLEQPVALKFLPPELERDRESLDRLIEEVKVALKISHPNVCRVYDLGEAEGTHFLSMEYIDGEDLSSLLRRIGRLPRGKAVELGRQICDGLAAAHEAGILHRDLKPANLMIDGDGRAKITDFGLAAVSETIRGHEVRSGTPNYMAPEQLDGREVSERSDVFALGLVLHEIFTGRRVFAATRMSDLLALHRAETPEALRDSATELDPDTYGVIRRCLARDPAERFASAREVGLALAGEAEELEEGTRLRTLLTGGLVQADRLVEKIGDSAGAALLRSHEELARGLAQEHGATEIDRSGDLLLLFERPWEAVRFALAYHRGVEELGKGSGVELEGRLGIHLGEVVVRRSSPQEIGRGARPIELEGLAKPTVGRLRSLAVGGQTLLTRAAFDLARRGAVGEIEEAERLRWLAHGEYRFEGAEEGLEVFEVGLEGAAPLAPPADSAAATRVADQHEILGWRPAPGLEIPHRTSWVVEEKLGEGGFGEVWLGLHAKSGEHRVYKFCYEAERLQSLQREITVFRLLKEELGLRDDIVRIIDWNLEKSPYFIEFPHVEGGSLADWATARGGMAEVPLEERLEIVAQVASALAAAHSVGVLHKDIKPGNVLMTGGGETRAKAVLTDFGLGQVTEQKRLAELGITVLGLTEMETDSEMSSTAGTRLYLAPELLAGQPPTIQADIYALGVMLYQVAVGDLDRPLAQGWERHVDDELLREDIASMIEGSPARRPGNAAEVAERLRSLDERRAEREAERRATLAAERAQRRRKVLTVVASVSSVFLVVVSLLAFQAIRARQDAERRRGQAEQMIDFMLNDLYESLDKIGRLDLLEDASRSSKSYFDSLDARDESPEALYKRGITLTRIGDVLLEQGDAEAALGTQRSALALFERAAERDPANDDWLEGQSLSRYRVGRVLRERGETGEALAAYREALEQAETLAGRHPDDPERRFTVAVIHHWLASLQRQIGGRDAVYEHAGAALELLEDLALSEEAQWRHHLLLIDTRILLAAFHRFNNADAEALAELQQARALADRLASEDPANAYWPRRLAAVHVQMGTLLSLDGKFRAALASQQQAIEAYRGLTVTDPARVEWRERLSFCYQIAGWIHTQLGEPDRALEHYEESRAILEKLFERDPDRLGWVRQLANSYQILGVLHTVEGRSDAAQASLERAVELRRRAVAASGDDPDPINYLSWTLLRLGDAYARGGQPGRAREIWSESLERIAPITADSDTLMYRDTHAQALLRLGRVEESRPLVEGLLADGFDDPDFLKLVRDSGLETPLP